jgi:hypothetical protein
MSAFNSQPAWFPVKGANPKPGTFALVTQWTRTRNVVACGRAEDAAGRMLAVVVALRPLPGKDAGMEALMVPLRDAAPLPVFILDAEPARGAPG